MVLPQALVPGMRFRFPSHVWHHQRVLCAVSKLLPILLSVTVTSFIELGRISWYVGVGASNIKYAMSSNGTADTVLRIGCG